MAMVIITNPFGAAAAIQTCQKEDLDAFDISWPTTAAANVIENFMFDDRNPANCYVYPPPTATSYVELVYVADPTDCATTSSALGIADHYQTALRYMVLSIAYEYEIEGASPERSEYYMRAALAALQGANQVKRDNSPNANNQDGKVTRTGGA